VRRRFWPGGAIIAAVLVLIGIAVTIVTATASTSAGTGTACATVYEITAPTSDPVGNLCAAVIGTGTTISKVTITFTATSSCTGSVVLRASGIDRSGTEFDKVSTVSCSATPAVATFRQVTEIQSGTDICGLLIAPETYTSAQACVPIS
jgi:hypothetical protein